ncbi:MAG: oxidoreductase [Methanospirillum sp.]|nr:oxidoreductase [Methanospirillum sp.]
MVGAVAALSSYEGLGVVVHGSSGCWFYPSSLLRVDIGCTDLSSEDAILGGEARVRAAVREVLPRHRRVAVVNTCVPAIAGEDLAGALHDLPVVIVDAPGFLGGTWTGHERAIHALKPGLDAGSTGVGIDGLNPLDPFARGNLHECERLLRLAGATPGPRFAGGRVESIEEASPLTVVANPAYAAGPGMRAGDLLGLDRVRETFARLAALDDRVDPGPVETECDVADERCVRACDKFLSRHDPPRAALFGEGAYVGAVALLLERYLGADCAVLGYRDGVNPPGRWNAVRADDLRRVEDALVAAEPDLVLGSSFEQRLRPSTPFVPLAPPIRGRWRLAAAPLAGIEGTLGLIEAVLNACAGVAAP